MKSNWRSALPVFVPEAQTTGAVGVIRSLGRAGYPVHASSPVLDALGLQSRFASEKSISPKYDSPEFLPWLRALILGSNIKAIVPSEGFLLAIRQHFEEFSALLPYARNAEIVYAGMSKSDQITRFTSRPFEDATGAHLPPFLIVQGAQLPSPDALAQLGSPLYIKVDACYAKQLSPSRVYKVSSLHDAQPLLSQAASTYRKLLVEGHVPGRGVGAFFLLWDQQVRAEFMHIRLHEVPHTGGVSSYRKSWWHQAIRDDALQKLKALEWQGVAMMEYRWDQAQDQFYFMEMNGRFWGSLHLALQAGVDFPTMLLDVFHGQDPPPPRIPKRDVKCRYTFPSDLMFVRSRWKDPAIPWYGKIWSAIEFVLLGLNPRVGSDLWFPRDTRLYWTELARFVKRLLPHRKARSAQQ
jgi:hypothetical protein